MDWYVFFLKSGNERKIELYIDKVLKQYPQIVYKIFIPQRELLEYHQGDWCKTYKTLFSGYLLIYTSSIDVIYKIIREEWHSDIYSILKADKCFQKINLMEITPILNLADSQGILRISDIYIEKEKLTIIDGPLSKVHENIKKINKRKRRATITLKFLDKKCDIDLSINCLKSLDQIKNRSLITVCLN